MWLRCRLIENRSRNLVLAILSVTGLARSQRVKRLVLPFSPAFAVAIHVPAVSAKLGHAGTSHSTCSTSGTGCGRSSHSASPPISGAIGFALSWIPCLALFGAAGASQRRLPAPHFAGLFTDYVFPR